MGDAAVGLGKRLLSPLVLLHVVGSMCTFGMAASLLAILLIGFDGVLVISLYGIIFNLTVT